jgi:hypothetical protein
MYQLSKFLFSGIDLKWHEELLQFIDSGDASPEFLAFLDRDPECQRVVEIAFMIVSQKLEASAQQLKAGVSMPATDDATTAAFAHILAKIVAAYLDEFSEEQQQKVAIEVATSLGPTRKHALQLVLKDVACRDHVCPADFIADGGRYMH